MMSEGKCCERRRRGRSCTKPTFFHILDATKHQQQRQQPAIISVIRFTGNLNIFPSQLLKLQFPIHSINEFQLLKMQLDVKRSNLHNQFLVIVAFPSTTGLLCVVLHRCSKINKVDNKIFLETKE